ncbi:MAG: TerB family tellurite resistance protein [Acetobacteraceae bacterium]
MGYWGKIIGGVAGFAVGGPPGAVVGLALGHAADSGALPRGLREARRTGRPGVLSSARLAALLGRRDQLFAIGVVVLSAKLAKCDGPVVRAEIDAFKRHFRIPPESVHDIGRLFDQARDSTEGFEGFAQQMGEAFADNQILLEEVLTALFAIARADGALNGREQDYLTRVHRLFGLAPEAWDRARGTARRTSYAEDDLDPYVILGVGRSADNDTLRAAWKKLMRENHPDGLAARGVPPEFIARATEKVASINAAWDRIKRERGL